MRFRPEEGGKNRTDNRSAQARPVVLVRTWIYQFLELFGERSQRIETRSRNSHPYRNPVCRDDGSYLARPFAAWMVGPEKSKLDRWKK
jgi:hypothetical protein